MSADTAPEDQCQDVGERSPSLIERWLVRQAKECLATVQYAEDNEGDWAGMLPSADRERLRSNAQQLQYAADCIASLVQEITRLRRPTPEGEVVEALAAFVSYHDRLNGMSVDELLIGDGTSEPDLRARGRAALEAVGRTITPVVQSCESASELSPSPNESKRTG